MDTELVQVIIQGGAVGLGLVALLLVGYTIRILTNHLTHVANILGRVEANLSILIQRLTRGE